MTGSSQGNLLETIDPNSHEKCDGMNNDVKCILIEN